MIQNIPNETALVIAGAWNVAILTPEWVLRNGLERDGEDAERVQVFIPTGAGVVFEFPRYTFGDFSYVVRPDALIVAPPEMEQGNFERCEDAVARMLYVLRHTPVTGVGHNFEFRDNEPERVAVFTAARQDLADEMPNPWEPAAVNITSSFKSRDGTLILNITRVFDAGVLVVKFNFHHVVTSTDQALNILRGQADYSRMWDNYETATKLIQKLYGGRNGN